MSRFVTGSVLALVLGGCLSTGPAKSALPAQGVAPPLRDAWQDADNPVAAAMRRISAQMLKAGAETGGLELSGFMPAGARRSYPLVVPAARCATVVVLGSQGLRDLDAALYTPEGTMLAADAQPDAHPTIQVCAGKKARQLYLILHAYEGAGTFLAVGFIGQAQSLPMAARVLGTEPAVARLQEAESMIDRVTIFTEGVRKRGFEPEGKPMRIPIRRAQRIRLGFQVRSGACYTAAGFALKGIEDMNLRVFDDEGKEVAQDLAATSDAATQFCSDRDAQFAAEAQAVAGSGSILLAFYRAGSSQAGGPQGLWLGRRTEVIPERLPLEDALRRDLELAERAGFKPTREQQLGRLLPGQAVAHRIELPAGRCARIVATPGRGIVRLSVALHALEGGEPLPVALLEPRRMVHLCTKQALTVEAQVVAEAGAGRYALTALAKRVDSVRAGAPEAHRLQAEGAALEDGFQSDTSWNTRAGLMRLDSVDPATRLPLSVPAGQCVRIYVYGEGGGVRARLRKGKVTLHTALANGAPLRTCAKRDAALQGIEVELQATSGTPKVRAWVFRRDAK